MRCVCTVWGRIWGRVCGGGVQAKTCDPHLPIPVSYLIADRCAFVINLYPKSSLNKHLLYEYSYVRLYIDFRLNIS